MDEEGRLRGTVHLGYVYLLRQRSGDGETRCDLFRTHNLHEWEEVVVESNRFNVLNMLSHHDKLYCSGWVDIDGPMSTLLYRLEAGPTSVTSRWELVPNGDSCTYDGYFETMFAVDNSIVFAGCRTNVSLPVVAEYNVVEGEWVPRSKWPDLPQPVVSCSAVVSSNAVHLIGGVSLARSSGRPSKDVFTMELSGRRPIGEAWQVNRLPRPPHVCSGAADLHGLLVVAGGHDGTSYSKSCYALDPLSQDWIPLPSLVGARACTGLLSLPGRGFVAVGGTFFQSRGSTSFNGLEVWETRIPVDF